MSSAGIRRARSTDSRIADSILDEDRIQIESEKIFKETGDASTSNSPGIANLGTPAGNFLSKSGDTREGPMGNQFGIVEIIDDTIDVSLGSQNFFPVMVLNGEGGAADALTRIVPGSGVFLNHEIIVQAGSFAITLQETGGGNILTPGTAAFNLEPGDYAKLIFSVAAGNKWIVVWFSGNVGSGGGGISFPIDFPEDDRETVGASTQDILFSASTRHSVFFTITGDVALAFSSAPTNKTAYSIITITQDGVGGHTLTLPAGTVNKDIVEAGFLTDADDETGILIEFKKGAFYAFLETGNNVSGGAGIDQWSTFPAIQTVSMATNGMTGLTIANIVDTGGIARGSISGDATLGMVLSTALGGKLSIQDVITPIATFDNTTGLKMEGTHVIDMNKNIINTIRKLSFDGTQAVTPIDIQIDYNTSEEALVYHVPTNDDVHLWKINTELMAVLSRIGTDRGQLSVTDIIASNPSAQATSVLQTNGQLFIADSSTDPTTNGEFRKNGTDVKVFTGGILVNLSDAGEFFGPWTATHDAGSQLLDNLANLNTDAANLPTSGKFKLGNDELISWVKTDNISVVSIGLRSTNLFALTGANLSLVGNDIVDTNLLEGRLSNPLNINIPTNGQILNFQFQGVNEWTLSQSTLGGDSIILNNSFILNSSGADPTNDGQFTRNVDSVILQSPTTQFQRAIEGTQSGQLALVKVDPGSSSGDGIYRINFKVLDTPTTTTYAQIKADIGDATDAGLLQLNVRADGSSNVNAISIEGSPSTSNRTFVSLNAESRIGSDLKFQAPTGSTDLKIFPALNQLGIVVQDNVSFTGGTEGMLAMPSSILPAVKTRTNMDAALGTHKGAFGFDEGLLIRLWIRHSSGSWYGFDFDASVTTG